MLRRAALAAMLIAVMSVTASCSWVSGLFGHHDASKPTSVSVFDAKVGDCFVAPADVKAELANLSKVPCDVAHQQELFAKVDYQAPGSQGSAAGTGTTTSAGLADAYPGDAALDKFAQGACAEKYTGYVGIAYPDSGLWLTYLLPSARSWQQGADRQILCFVTTTAGGSLTKSVKGSKL